VPTEKPRHSSRDFLALTQTSKQLRSEFRPLWLRASSVRLRFDDIDRFIKSFYSTVSDYGFAPKLLVMSWYQLYNDEDADLDSAVFNISALLRLGAYSPTSKIEFVPHRLIEYELSNVERDDYGHSLHCDCGFNDCDHDAGFETAHKILRDEMYYYLQPLNDILSNYTESWTKALHNAATTNKFQVKFAVDTDRQEFTAFIHFWNGDAPQYFTKKNLYNGAVRYLDEMGLLDIEHNYMVDYVVGKATNKFTRHSQHCHFVSAAYD
jgi:hypothetical protein